MTEPIMNSIVSSILGIDTLLRMQVETVLDGSEIKAEKDKSEKEARERVRFIEDQIYELKTEIRRIQREQDDNLNRLDTRYKLMYDILHREHTKFVYPIVLADLKKNMPEKFTRRKRPDWSHDEKWVLKEEILVETPLLSIIAFYNDANEGSSYGRHTVNKVQFSIKVVPCVGYENRVSYLTGCGDDDWRYTMLVSKTFKTVEDAEDTVNGMVNG